MILTRHDLHALPPLHQAAGAGDVAELTRLLAEVEVDSRADIVPVPHPAFAARRDLTPLMVAAGCETGSVEAVRALLARGADPRAVSAAGVGPLWYAAGSGGPERVAVLLAAGGDPRAVASDGRSAVAVAARAGSAEALRLLVQAGASPHPPGERAGDAGLASEAIPLFAAAAAGRAAGVRLLLEAGAEATLVDGAGSTALMFALSAEVVRLLLGAGCPRDARNMSGDGALRSALNNYRLAQEAARREHPECGDLRELEPAVLRRQAAVVAALLDAGVSPNWAGPGGEPALVGYCRSADVSVALVRLLLARGATVGARDGEGRTALHAAAENAGHPPDLPDVIRVLVEAGLPVDARDGRGRTPLHRAVGDGPGDRRVVLALLALGADLEARDGGGMTPLLVAAGTGAGSSPVVRHLLELGADSAARTPDGRTALDVAGEQVARMEQEVAAPGQAVGEAAERRLALRSARVTVGALRGSVPEAPAGLPAPVWLGYRLRPRRAPGAALPPQAEHIEELCGCEHAQHVEGMNRAACFASVADVPDWYRDTEGGEALEVYAYRAIPQAFDGSGMARPLSVEDLLGPGSPAPEVPDLNRFERLGHDVTQYLGRECGDWTGCSPLSPDCNGACARFSALVNRHGLLDDLGAAHDLALHFGAEPPEPGPYVIVEVWRAAAR